MKRDPKIIVADILQSIKRIEKYTVGLTEKDFLLNEEIQDAVMKRLEVIGEAVKHIPEKIKKEHSEIPWREIAGMRDMLIHEYFGIVLKRIWYTLQEDLPKFKKQIFIVEKEFSKMMKKKSSKCNSPKRS